MGYIKTPANQPYAILIILLSYNKKLWGVNEGCMKNAKKTRYQNHSPVSSSPVFLADLFAKHGWAVGRSWPRVSTHSISTPDRVPSSHYHSEKLHQIHNPTRCTCRREEMEIRAWVVDTLPLCPKRMGHHQGGMGEGETLLVSLLPLFFL